MRKSLANFVAAISCAAMSLAALLLVTLAATDRSMWPYLRDTAVIFAPVLLFLSIASVLPIALLLQGTGRFTFRAMMAVGACVGIVPAIFVGLLNGDFGLAFLELFCFSAGAGALGSLTYYFVFLGLGPNNSFKPKPLRGSA